MEMGGWCLEAFGEGLAWGAAVGNFSLVVVPPCGMLRLDYVLARAGAVFDDPVPVSLLPTSLSICVVLGFVLPHPFIPSVYFA